MHFRFPPPDGDTELERLISTMVDAPDLLKRPQLVGRKGQAQHGVDVLAAKRGVKGNAIYVGYQCKNVKELSIDKVRAECDKAKGFSLKLAEYVIATTLQRDAALQTEVENLSYDFTVSIWFWNDINDRLNRSAQLAYEHYSRIARLAQPEAARTHAEALRRALERPAFRDRVENERNVDDMIEALASTLAFLRTGFLYTRQGDLVESTLPWHGLEEPSYRKFCQKLETALDKLYCYTASHRSDLNNAGSASGAAAVVVTDYRNQRAKLINLVNRQFIKFQLQELPVPMI